MAQAKHELKPCPRCGGRLVLTAAGLFPAAACRDCGFGALIAIWEAGMEAVASREAAVPSAISRVAAQVEELDALRGMLEKRVALVSRPVGPEATPEREKRPNIGVPMVGQLDALRERLEQICRRLRDQIERIELPG